MKTNRYKKLVLKRKPSAFAWIGESTGRWYVDTHQARWGYGKTELEAWKDAYEALVFYGSREFTKRASHNVEHFLSNLERMPEYRGKIKPIKVKWNMAVHREVMSFVGRMDIAHKLAVKSNLHFKDNP